MAHPCGCAFRKGGPFHLMLLARLPTRWIAPAVEARENHNPMLMHLEE